MDEDRSKGTGKKIVGTIKETIGKVTGNKKLEDEGRMDKGEGKVQNTAGETKDEVRKHTP